MTDSELAALPGDVVLPYNAVPPGWQAHVLMHGGEDVAVLVYCGTEVHLNVKPGHQGRVLSRKALRELAAPIMDQWGFITTKLPIGSDKDREFIERIGFSKTWSSETFDYFILTTQPYERKK
jgi:hypothetical protein